ALRIVWQVARSVRIPIIGIGGIQSIDDVMEFLVAGASAVQVGTASFYNPGIACQLVSELPDALRVLNADAVSSIVGSIRTKTG
ncbi:MAG: HisA/HisF-related TIM barrel protein, partial [Phycisphaerae bacterium]